jgi:MHS family alpha-ketoglutarate permease-like MFS transporter
MNTSRANIPAVNPPATDVAKRFRDLVAVNFGNTLEWYDWTIYTIFASYFSTQFFQSQDPVSALLATLAVFAVGFITRPLGGFLFGAYADRVGRKKSLTLAMMITAAGSLVIAVAPTFDTVGIAASLILLAARLIQGLAHGGEMGTSVTYLVERAPKNRRALYGSSSWVSVVLGTILATFTGLIINSVLDESQIAAWGWRVAFGIGGILGLYALYLRRKIAESDVFVAATGTGTDTDTDVSTPVSEKAGGGKKRTEPMLRALIRNWRGVAVVFGLSAGGSIMFYTWLIFTPTFAQLNRGQDPTSALTASLIAQVIFLIAIPFVGWLSDRFGRRLFVVLFGIGFILLTFPLDGLIDGSFSRLLAAMIIALAILACLFGVNGAIWAEVFPTSVRAAGVAGPLSLATAIFGGTAPYINTFLAQSGQHNLFLVYLMVVSGITLLTAFLMPETKNVDLTRRDDVAVSKH